MFKTNFALQRWCCYPANWHPLLYFIFIFCMWLSVRTCFLSTRLYLFYFALALHISACTFGSVGWRFLTCSYWPHQPAHFLLSVVSWLLSHPKIPSTWPHFISFSFLLLFFPRPVEILPPLLQSSSSKVFVGNPTTQRFPVTPGSHLRCCFCVKTLLTIPYVLLHCLDSFFF